MKATNCTSTFDLQPSRLHQAIQGILLASVLTVSVAAHAESTNNTGSVKHSYHISGGTLGQALRQFATNSELLFSAETKLIDGKTSAGLNGEYTVEEGFRKLLAGSGLTYTLTDNNSVAIKVADTGKDAAVTLPTVTVTGKSDANSPYNTDYTVKQSSTATKSTLSLRDIPQSVQIIPHQVMEDRGIINFQDAFDNVSGISQSAGDSGMGAGAPRLNIRGFESKEQSSLLRDGFRQFGYLPSFEQSNIERIEVMKGPSSVLYGGAASIGGKANVISKQPLYDPYYHMEMNFGSYDFYRPSFDIGGPLKSDQSIRYRLNFASRNNNSFVDFVNNDNVSIAPAVSWDITPDTTLTLLGQYSHFNGTVDPGLPVNPISLNLPLNRYIGEPGFNQQTFDAGSATAILEHRFNEDWRFRSGFNASITDGRWQYTYPRSVNPATLNVSRRIDDQLISDTTYTWQNELFGKFNTWGLKHDVVLGVEHSEFGQRYPTTRSNLPPLNIFNPRYGNAPTFDFNYLVDAKTDNVGLYYQDLIELTPKLKLLHGGRFDWYDTTAYYDFFGIFVDKGKIFEYSPRVGLVYQLFEETSVYSSWSNSISPSIFGPGLNGTAAKPEQGEQYEIGIRQDIIKDKLNANLAFYHLKKGNVITSSTTGGQSIQVGEQRSQGLELDVTGSPMEGLKLIGSYSLTDAEVTKDNDIPVGDSPFNVSQHMLSSWLTYEFMNGPIKGFGMGAGGYYGSKREATLPNTFELPSYVRFDASVFYKFKKNWKAQVNLKNLNDERYYDSVGYALRPAMPFNVLGTISYDF
jgi:iron complex outermembrane receptor protein